MKQIFIQVEKYKYPLLLVVLPLIFFNRLILDQQSLLFPSQDIISIFFQEKALIQNTVINDKTLPLWNPYVFSGSPFIGNPTSAMFYPINLLFIFLRINLAFNLIFVIDTIFIGIFTYFFAKSIKLDKFSSFISAITIAFSGPMLSLIFPGHLINFDTFVWFPLILFIYEKVLRKQKIIYSVLAGFPIALTLLAGAPQIAVFSLLSASIYLALRASFNLPNLNKFLYLRRIFIIFFISIVIGFLLASVQIIPASEFSALSVRSGGLSYDFASDFSLNPKQIISFIFPYFFGNPANGTYWGKGNFWGLNGYIGILPLVLAILSLVKRQKSLTIIFFTLGLFALLFSFGKYSFVFPFFYKYVPQFDHFRVPARFLYIYAFSLAILAGIGTNALIKKTSALKTSLSKISILIFLTSIFGLAVWIFLLLNNSINFYEKYILNNSYAVGINHLSLYFLLINDVAVSSIVLFVFSVILFLWTKNKLKVSFLKVLFAAIILLDLWLFGSKFIIIKKINKINLVPNFAKTFKNDNENYRIFDKKGLHLPTTEMHKIENITGVHSLYIEDYRDFIWSIGRHENKPYESFFEIKNIQYPIFLDLLNVKYVITDNNTLSKNSDYLPRAYIVPNAIVLPKREILSKLKSKSFDPKKEIILQKYPNVSLTNHSKYKEVNVRYNNPNQIELNINMQNPGFLVLSEIHYPGWKASDNGKEIEIYKADYILRSIYLTKGIHKISLTYSPISYKIGKTISISTLFLCLGFLLYKRKTLFG